MAHPGRPCPNQIQLSNRAQSNQHSRARQGAVVPCARVLFTLIPGSVPLFPLSQCHSEASPYFLFSWWATTDHAYDKG
jgi:hypothetical protein